MRPARGLAVALVVGLALPALATPGIAAVELYFFESTGPVWHWVEVVVPQPGVLTVRADIAPRAAVDVAGGLWVLDAPGQVLRARTAGSWSPDYLQVHAEALGLDAADVVQARGPPNLGLREDIVLDAGTYRVVAVFGGDAALTGMLALTGDAGMTIGASRTGDAVLFAREHDLDAIASVGASVPVERTDPLEARVVNQASTAITAEGSLFGAFHGSANLLLDMALVTPEGVQNGQRHYALDNTGHGAFQFLVRTFADAAPPGCDLTGACERSGVWVLAGDVAL